VFFAFKGGKGVATAAGILFGVEPLLGAAVMGTWLIVAFFFRYSSLAALAASLFAPAYYLFGNQIAWQTSDAELLAVMVMSALLLMRHKDNIARLVSGQETKIGAKKEAPAEETDAQA
jgi:glycerol-3-phosphate acyltransferase PlsY